MLIDITKSFLLSLTDKGFCLLLGKMWHFLFRRFTFWKVWFSFLHAWGRICASPWEGNVSQHFKASFEETNEEVWSFFVVWVFLKFSIYKVELDGETLSLEIIKARALKKDEIKLSRANTYLPINGYLRLHNWNPSGENTLWGVEKLCIMLYFH